MSWASGYALPDAGGKDTLDSPFLPTLSNQTCPGKASIPTAFLHRAQNSCCFWFSRAPTKTQYTRQDRHCHMDASTYPSCSLGVWVPLTGNLNFHLSQQVSRPYTLCSPWCTHSCSTDQFQVVGKGELQQGKLASEMRARTQEIQTLPSRKLHHLRATKGAHAVRLTCILQTT